MYFILYTSESSEQCSSEDINSILEVSRRNNPSNSVTGLLIYKKPGFLQYLEGPEQAVAALYETIKKDRRHASIATIKDGMTVKSEKIEIYFKLVFDPFLFFLPV